MRALTIWFSGLSGSGKTTLANELYKILKKTDKVICLDGDVLRKGLNSDLGLSIDSRKENCRRAAEVAKMFMHEDYIVIASFITPTEDLREVVRDVIGREHLMEIFLSTSVEICEQRDPKGLYQLARQGKIAPMSGLGAPFEWPKETDITIDTSHLSINECLALIKSALAKKRKNTIRVQKNSKRGISLFKAISWRLLGTLGTIIVAWFISGQWDFAIQIGIVEFILKIGLFYIHDRAWDSIAKESRI